MKCQRKEEKDFSTRLDSLVKTRTLFFGHQHNTPQTKMEIEEFTRYLFKAQEIVTRWNERLENE